MDSGRKRHARFLPFPPHSRDPFFHCERTRRRNSAPEISPIRKNRLPLRKTSDDTMKSGPKTPLRKHSLADTLAQRLQRRIAAGKFRTGERLPTESELMRMFGVGRSTVREAVRMLSDRGFLNVRQGAGTFVAAPAASDALVEQRLRRADIRELDEVRKILEAAIVERAAARRTPQDMERIESLLAQRGTAAEEGDLEPVHARRHRLPCSHSRSHAQRNPERTLPDDNRPPAKGIPSYLP